MTTATIDMKKNFGTQLASFRTEKKLSVRGLAKAAGMENSYAQLSRMEKQGQLPSLDTLHKIFRAMGYNQIKMLL
jgi:transcriptional regulator with XRE-family HTH domain